MKVDIEGNKERFISLLRSTNREGIEKVLNWLESDRCDFFRAPASAKFHGNYPGGLCEHSLNVYNTAMHMRDYVLALSHKYGESVAEICPDESVIICALLHDICKTNLYDKEIKVFKDENAPIGNQWKHYESYVINDKFPMGHGEKSVFLLQKLGLQLSGQEALAIRHHMGIWDIGAVMSDYLKHAYNQTMNTVPLAVLIALSDAFASYTMEECIDPKENPID